jgi:uncharacterized membrane protein YraQ (UPF0718 family)
MTFPSLEAGLLGGLVRVVEGIAHAAPTFIVGLLIAAIFRYYFGREGIRQLFGGNSLRALPQSWAIGMLLPVCSIGVLPILVEMRRARVKPGAMSAFALSAPLFNPLSLLYGLTLSRPMVVIMFAFGSLLVVTLVGLVWDRYSQSDRHGSDEDRQREYSGDQSREKMSSEVNDGIDEEADTDTLIGTGRLLAIGTYMTRAATGSTGIWALVGVSGLMMLSMVLPWGSMQHSVERDDWTAPATMTAVAIPAYATPMLAMSQLGMMFQHANSPGAAFVLLVLGTGVNVATLCWMAVSFGKRSVMIWFSTLVLIVVGIAYTINRPLVPHGVEPAGHTHAFDVYTNPIHSLDVVTAESLWKKISDSVDLGAAISTGVLAWLIVVGVILRVWSIDERRLRDRFGAKEGESELANTLPSYDRVVSEKLVGGVMIFGLISLSIVMCYAYYPSPREVLEEVRIVRAECLTAVTSENLEAATYWLGLWDDWSRRLEVGTFIRRGEIRPYQQMQGYLIRKKLELLEHELEHDPYEPGEAKKVLLELMDTDRRWAAAFRK